MAGIFKAKPVRPAPAKKSLFEFCIDAVSFSIASYANKFATRRFSSVIMFKFCSYAFFVAMLCPFDHQLLSRGVMIDIRYSKGMEVLCPFVIQTGLYVIDLIRV